MILTIVEKINNMSFEFIDSMADKIGLSSIATSVGVVASQEMSHPNWVFADYALLISLIGGSLFIIEKLIVIYLRLREAARLEKNNKK